MVKRTRSVNNNIVEIPMVFNPLKHHRRSIRLKGYDYSQGGAYFVTISVQDRECLLGNIVDGRMLLNQYGKMVEFTWNDLPNHNYHVQLDEYIIMPNHVHGIIIINHDGVNTAWSGFVGAGSEPAPTKTKTKHHHHGLSEIIRQFKTFSARRVNHFRQSPGIHVWQRNYYEHIIRNNNDLYRIRKYIIANPLKWDLDIENPNKTGNQ